MKPIIGITAEHVPAPDHRSYTGEIRLPSNYAECVARAGGVPIVVPPDAEPFEVARILDGWLIPGGRDIDASRWGEPNHPANKLQDASRFELERALFELADPDLPVLGICYGCQAINVIRGGTLEQHLPDRLGHHDHEGGTLAEVCIAGDSLLGRILGSERVAGKSYHHQAVAMLGEGLRVVARHSDGTVEGVEATDRAWVVGVQWHPERTPESQATQRLFQAFVERAWEFSQRRREAAWAS